MNVTKPFAATGRGRRLAQLVNLPLKAQEFGRRKKLQELILSGELPILSEQSLNEYYGPHCNGIGAEGLGDNNNNRTANKHITSSCSTASRRHEAETNFSLNGQTQVQDLGMIEPREHSHGLNRTGNPKFAGNKLNQNALDSNRQTASTDNNDREMKNVLNLSTCSAEEIGCSAVGNNVSGTSSWADWERSVVIEGGVDEEDLDKFALVEDNDDINDVMVQQYINALHDEQKNGTTDRKDMKITPTRVQQISKLKSTTNADSAKHPPGMLPNPPKGMNRWGGSELNGVKEPTGWGDIEEGSQNWYNDGVSIWDSTCADSKVGNRTKTDTNGKSTEVQQSGTAQSGQSTKLSSRKVGEIKSQTKAKTHPSCHVPSSPNGPLQQGRSKGLGKTPGWGSSRTFSKSSGTTTLRRTQKHLKIKLNNGHEAKQLNSTKSPVHCGGSVRQGLVESSGWGDTDDSLKNWYDDGSSLWDSASTDDATSGVEWK